MTHFNDETRLGTSLRRFTVGGAALVTASAMVATLVTPVTAHAQRRGEPRLQVTYPTDGSLTCDQLTTEIARMEEIAGISAQNAQNAQTQGAVADGVASVAINAALYSGALGAVPGLGMFANLAGAGARRAAEARARAEQENIQVATQRRTLLSGIYQGRQCGVPAAAPAAAAAPTTISQPAPDTAQATDAVVQDPAAAVPAPVTTTPPAR